MRFYFDDVLEQLKTVYKFSLQKVSLFLSFCVTKHLRDGRESCHVG